MKLLVVSQPEVRRLLSMAQCMEAIASAFEMLGRGSAVNPLRSVLWLGDGTGALGTMPGVLGSIGRMGVKVISVFPGNQGTGYDSHQGVVLLFDTVHGRPLALLDATEVTAIRTAAVSGVATRLLARENARDLALLGSGVQAHTHLEAMSLVRRLERVRVWSPTPEHADAFARRESQRYGFDVEAVGTARGAVEGADIVCTMTSSREPVLEGAWLSPGTHVNAVGASAPFARELDSAAVRSARLFVDRLESARVEAGDYLIALGEGAIAEGHILGELADLVLGRVPGREAPDDITLFKSLGLAIEDVASAELVYEQAVSSAVGTWVELGDGEAPPPR